MDAGEEGQSDAAIISHGICNDCADNVEFQLGVSIKKFLDSFNMPVVMLDVDGRAITANRNALDLLKKELVAIKHVLLGNIFECAYSRLPGGCGKTTHCSGCTIRSAIKDTFTTGRSNIKLPATVAYNRDDLREGVSLLISTEKALNYVLLKFEPVMNSEAEC